MDIEILQVEVPISNFLVSPDNLIRLLLNVRETIQVFLQGFENFFPDQGRGLCLGFPLKNAEYSPGSRQGEFSVRERDDREPCFLLCLIVRVLFAIAPEHRSGPFEAGPFR